MKKKIYKENISKQDQDNISFEMLNLTGVKTEVLKKDKISWIVVLLIGIIEIFISVFFNNRYGFDFSLIALDLLGIVLIIRSLAGLIFLEKSYNKRVLKRIQKQNKEIRKKYNIPDFEENTVEISDDYIEVKGRNEIKRFENKDYVSNTESSDFYIIEFKQGEFLFFKKEIFENRQQFNSIINFLEEKKSFN